MLSIFNIVTFACSVWGMSKHISSIRLTRTDHIWSCVQRDRRIDVWTWPAIPLIRWSIPTESLSIYSLALHPLSDQSHTNQCCLASCSRYCAILVLIWALNNPKTGNLNCQQSDANNHANTMFCNKCPWLTWKDICLEMILALGNLWTPDIPMSNPPK